MGLVLVPEARAPSRAALEHWPSDGPPTSLWIAGAASPTASWLLRRVRRPVRNRHQIPVASPGGGALDTAIPGSIDPLAS